MPSEGSRQRRDLEAGVGSLRRMGNGTFTRWETELGRPSPAPGLMIPAEGRPYKPTGERGGRRKGVRGGRSTDEGQDNITCSREGPTGEDMLAKRVVEGMVANRRHPTTLVGESRSRKHDNVNASFGRWRSRTRADVSTHCMTESTAGTYWKSPGCGSNGTAGAAEWTEKRSKGSKPWGWRTF